MPTDRHDVEINVGDEVLRLEYSPHYDADGQMIAGSIWVVRSFVNSFPEDNRIRVEGLGDNWMFSSGKFKVIKGKKGRYAAKRQYIHAARTPCHS